ncbi:RING finger protein nhl-1-like [Centruroides sculpturatus]|uniref:RING finger protein nhl-1-like n=1 Tax=Centruroides sculpturatus TaxID=218467 RepID=UPI000C6EE6E8|nr:RING finger protein nhl-1-like [Centruroides sculpturatus]XP_023228923.1 RING finger protein nhl-1-like [Centruroides sculpturatus]XP_023228924.1 RING finger protein nhl-1-like [Centruroides sculpturatus]
MTAAWNQMDVLLTCSVCNERFKNPKLLPCQHTFCMEPCLEKVADSSRHQVKCPECNAEHRIPYQGVQAFPNNVTLTRFLELRVSVNGQALEPPPSMLRCAVCNEKERLEKCCHCNKKICQSCKKAHVALLKQEIVLINGQVKVGLANLSGTLNQTKQNKDKLQENYKCVKHKIEELIRRYTSDLEEAEEKLKHELEVYLCTEERNITKLKNDLELEIKNITSNCEMVEKYMSNGVEWTDAELMDYKDVFQRTLDFVRNFEPDTSDFSRRVKFHSRTDLETFRKSLKEFCKLENSPSVVAIPNLYQNGLILRSQSDHRLAMQHSRHEEPKTDASDREPYRRFGDRNVRERSVERDAGRHDDNYLSPRRREDSRRGSRGQSREGSPEVPRIVEERVEKIVETEDATKGPISKVVRLLDSPQVMEKLHQSEVRKKQQQKEQERKAQQPPPRPVSTYQPRIQRQVSEDDVDKQKKQNQAAAASTSDKDDARSVRRTSDTTTAPKPRQELRSFRTSTESETETANGRRVATDTHKPPVSPRQPPQPARPPRSVTAKSGSTETEDKTRSTPPRPRLNPVSTKEKNEEPETRKKPFVSRFLVQRKENDKRDDSSDSSSDDEKDGKTSNRGDLSPSVSELLARSAQARRQSLTSTNLGTRSPLYPAPSEGPGSWRDALRRRDSPTSSARRRPPSEESEDEPSPYLRYSERRRSVAALESNPATSDRNRFRSRIARSKSSHDIALGEESEEDSSYTRSRTSRFSRETSPAKEMGGYAQYLKNKYARNRIRNEGGGSDDSSDEEDGSAGRRRDGPVSRYGENFGSAASRRHYLQKGKPVLKFGTRGSEPGCFTWPRGVATGQDVVAVADSSNHRVQIFNSNGKFLHEFGSYGSGEGEFDCLAAVTVAKNGHYVVSDRYNHRLQVFDPTGRFVNSFGGEGRADGKFNYPWGLAADALGFVYVCDKENHRIQVFQLDGTYVSKFGSAGSRPGELEHPHYIAVSNTNRVIVSDSNNHRIQIYDVNGRLLSTLGSEGTEEGHFKFPRGVAVDERGYVVVGDSGNNRIQVFQPDGTFLKAFGSWGSGDGEFKGLEGIAVNSTGGILVCDRENHRIQVF